MVVGPAKKSRRMQETVKVDCQEVWDLNESSSDEEEEEKEIDSDDDVSS